MHCFKRYILNVSMKILKTKVGEKMHQKKKGLLYENWHNSILKPKPKNIIIGKEGHFIMIKF